MIAERRARRPNRRMVAEQNTTIGKPGNQAHNLGDELMAVMANQVSVSTRYKALMAIDGDTGFGGTDGENRGGERERKSKSGGAEEASYTGDKGRVLGLKKTRATKEQVEKKLGRNTGEVGPHGGERKRMG